ncbi:MAG TPA: UDP-3-O-(3-hydroxymyristoyl)glucosamine N-acyltransferase, partial [Bacteroides coprosuis]|nr:UDP-3-O-(3-hydroxymyristoyl)glucosamine N-acyltransferase [Bacteroides coprosuis]
IDRATMGATIIRKGVKLDNLIQIAHNDEVGSHTVIAAQAGVAGSTKIGQWCMIGGQAGLAGHAKIGDKVGIAAQSGIPGNIKSGNQVMGSPAFEARQYFKAASVFKKLPDIYMEINMLRKELNEIKGKLK